MEELRFNADGKIFDVHIGNITGGKSVACIEYLHADEMVVAVEIQHNAIFDFAALGNRRFLEMHIQRIGAFAVLDFHSSSIVFVNNTDNQDCIVSFFVRDSEITSRRVEIRVGSSVKWIVE